LWQERLHLECLASASIHQSILHFAGSEKEKMEEKMKQEEGIVEVGASSRKG
jgi:hypothetical protein